VTEEGQEPVEKVQATFRDGIINRNRYLGRRMRYCGYCGVGVGIMDRKQYATRYIYGKGLCPTCGMQVHRGG